MKRVLIILLFGAFCSEGVYAREYLTERLESGFQINKGTVTNRELEDLIKHVDSKTD